MHISNQNSSSETWALTGNARQRRNQFRKLRQRTDRYANIIVYGWDSGMFFKSKVKHRAVCYFK